jgi:hypothetical protein
MPRSFELVGLDGANPLGFLAAVGTLVSLQYSGRATPKLSFKRVDRWVPVLDGVHAEDERGFADIVAESLRGRAVSSDAESRRATAQKAMEEAKKAIQKKLEEIRARRLRGTERQIAIEQEIRPLEREYQAKRGEWLQSLRESVPRPELALGRLIENCTGEEYRDHVDANLAAGRPARDTLEMLAAFGSDACLRGSGGLEPTPFSFIHGDGHQYFLDTARQLIANVSADGVQRVLFRAWDYRDEGLSMRWDPVEDRRYALMDRDPTASGNKPRGMWMANLLAYRALALFSSAPSSRGLRTAGWDARRAVFTWPLWEAPVGLDAVRSLVQLRELGEQRPDAHALRARGVSAAFRSNRIEVGSGSNRKWNFSPARRIV